tara:strand:+ start:615 stop:1073 length:459 start_codon:yes stop_codon:yes gene_type:complete
MLNKLISLLLVALMTIPTVVFADTPEVPPQPKITSIAKDQPAPYSGVLLNTVAAAKIFTEKEFIDMECELRIEYAVQKEILRLNLLLETSQATVESMDKKYTSLLDIKDQEIKRLGKVASETNDWSSLWYVGGIVTGIALTVAIVYAVKEVN